MLSPLVLCASRGCNAHLPLRSFSRSRSYCPPSSPPISPYTSSSTHCLFLGGPVLYSRVPPLCRSLFALPCPTLALPLYSGRRRCLFSTKLADRATRQYIAGRRASNNSFVPPLFRSLFPFSFRFCRRHFCGRRRLLFSRARLVPPYVLHISVQHVCVRERAYNTRPHTDQAVHIFIYRLLFSLLGSFLATIRR